MRHINIATIRDTVSALCLKANYELRADVLGALRAAVCRETNGRAKRLYASIVDNALFAKKKKLAICQDTGMVIVHAEIGQDVHVAGGSFERAIQDGVRDAYQKGCLRKSVVADPLVRKNTGTNTPALIYVDIVKGSRLAITVSPKGFGSENKSAIKMFRPTDPVSEIEKFIVDVVRAAGPDACPPYILGVGLGGTFEKAAYLAKKALLGRIDTHNRSPHLRTLEKRLKDAIDALKIGPMGLGGKTSALGVNVLAYPTHIAGLPVAVNVSCHATRSATRTI